MMAATVPAVLAQVAFTLVLLFVLLASGDLFYRRIVYAMPTFPDKRRAVLIARDIERQLSHHLLTITLVNVGLGVAIGLALWWLGMPNPLLFGVLACLLNSVPFLGAEMPRRSPANGSGPAGLPASRATWPRPSAPASTASIRADSPPGSRHATSPPRGPNSIARRAAPTGRCTSIRSLACST